MYQTFLEQYLAQGVALPTAMVAARAMAAHTAGAKLTDAQQEAINDADLQAWIAQALEKNSGGRVTARRYS